MRIISGELKGKLINFVKNSNTRPLKDSVRENIFNILTHSSLMEISIKNSKILDLYSGVGSFGIEGLSRRAKKVTFVERDYSVIKILNENLLKLSLLNRSKVFCDNIENILNKELNEKFNLFFFDPPFADSKYLKYIELIKKKKIFEKMHVVIIHREKETEENLDDFLKIIETKIYGRSKIFFGKFN